MREQDRDNEQEGRSEPITELPKWSVAVATFTALVSLAMVGGLGGSGHSSTYDASLGAARAVSMTRAATLEAGVNARGAAAFDEGERLHSRGSTAFAQGKWEEARSAFAESEALFVQAASNSSSKGWFRAGSSAKEQHAALALCEAHGGRCDATWYGSEVLREIEPGAFRLDATEVTRGAFARFVEATAYITDAERRGGMYRYLGHASLLLPDQSWRTLPGSSEMPVGAVSFNDAQAFCEWSGGRLPTEEEWEFVARGYERRVYPWGDDFDPLRAVWRQPETPDPVGSRPEGATPEGVHDMAGNVWEWVRAASGEPALKGGSYGESNPAQLRAATRRIARADIAHVDDGFRCRYDAAPPEEEIPTKVVGTLH